ncbi:hypothetical protein D3C73_1553010 [compost metagenome]
MRHTTSYAITHRLRPLENVRGRIHALVRTIFQKLHRRDGPHGLMDLFGNPRVLRTKLCIRCTEHEVKRLIVGRFVAS